MILTIPTIEIFSSVETEIKRLAYIMQKAKWYKIHHYRLSLPKGLTLDEIVSLSEKSLSQIVKREFVQNKSRTEKVIEKIREGWLKTPESIFSELNKVATYPKKVRIILTRYGTGGSYHLPNIVVVNIAHTQNPKIISNIIVHELIHLAIEPLVKKHEVSHVAKELIVELLVNKFYNNSVDEAAETKRKYESDPIIEKAFNLHYPNLDMVFQSIKKPKS